MEQKRITIRHIATIWGVGFLFGLGLWLAVALVSVIFFTNMSLSEKFFPTDPMHLFLRTLASFILMMGVIHVRIFRFRFRAATEILREVEQRYNILTEFSRDFIFIIDRQGIVRYVNSFGASQFGKRPQDIIGKARDELFPPNVSRRQEENLRLVFESGKPSSVEDNVTFPGNERWINTLLVPVRDDMGSVVAVMGISRDITDRKHTEQELRESEARFRELTESLPECIFEADGSGRVLFSNKAGFEKSGYTREDMENGVFVMDLIAPQDREIAKRNLVLLIEGRTTPLSEYTARRKDGSTYPVFIHSNPIVRDGRVVGFRGFVFDLTEQKRMEEQVRFQASILEHVRNIVVATDLNGKIVYWNKFAERSLQWTAEEVLGRDIMSLGPYDEATKALAFQCVNTALQTGCWDGEVFGWKKDGTTLPQYLTLSRLQDASGRPVGVVGVAIDISERKQAEEALRDSESKLKTILSSMVDLVFGLDQNGRFIFCHAPPGTRLILPPDQFIGKHFSEVLPPHLAELTRDSFEKNRRNQIAAHEYPLELRGQTVWFSAKISPIFLDNQFTGAVAVVRDITESKRTEQFIRESEQQYSATIEAINDAISVVDADLRFILSNAAYRQLAAAQGTGPDITGKTLFEVFPFLPQRVREEYRYVFNTGESSTSEETQGHNGYTGVFEIRRIPIFSGGKVLRVATVIRDITEQKNIEQRQERIRGELEILVQERTRELTRSNAILTQEIAERKRAVEALKESETKYRNIVENTLEVIMITQPDGVVSYLSPSCREVLGHDPEDLVATDPDIIYPEDKPTAAKVFGDALRGSNGSNFEYRIVTRAGQVKWVSHSWKPILGDHGLKMVVSVVRDITDRKRTEEVLRQTEKLAATGRMAARIAHEINNPLAGIKNSFRLIKSAIPENHTYYQYVGRIEREVDRIARIVRQMFDLYRPDQQSLEKFNLDESLRDVVALLEPIARDTGVTIIADADGVNSPLAMSDGLLRQILYNLIKNAVEASPAGATVKVAAAVCDNILTLSVADQGHGISDDVRSRIFEPFFTTKIGLKDGGLGLGLSITKSIIESMSGYIDFQSQPQQGTVFNVTLPLTKPKREDF